MLRLPSEAMTYIAMISILSKRMAKAQQCPAENLKRQIEQVSMSKAIKLTVVGSGTWATAAASPGGGDPYCASKIGKSPLSTKPSPFASPLLLST